MARKNLVERRFEAFMHTQLSLRKAMAVIVSATLVSVFIGGALITVLDPEEFPDLGTGLWWALQTVTTVGYGDVVPENTIGRLVGAVFMLEAIAFVAIVTAAITSSFVERAQRERVTESDAAEAIGVEQLSAQLAEITAGLARLERILERGSAGERGGQLH
jgi:voltage-gated potassium channel